MVQTQQTFSTSEKQPAGRRACRLCLRLLFLPVLCLALIGCKVDVYQGLSESQANIMLATLLKHGIQAEKKAAGKNGFSLIVDDSVLIQSLEILRENNLPREDFENLGKVFSGQSMIASSSEEQARLSYALAQELSDTFSRIDGVLTSRVHVVLASTDQTTGARTPPSAAVFLRHTPESQVVNLVPKIREVTAKAVPGLHYDAVSVMLVPVRETVGVPMQPQSGFLDFLSAEGGPPYLLIGASVLLLLAFAGLLALAVLTVLGHRKNSGADSGKEA